VKIFAAACTAGEKEASGIIKFLTGSCLRGLGIVLKKPLMIYFSKQNILL
jgi:hypothetical protein